MSYRRYKNVSDRDLVFAEYFNSEIETRRNGGVPTDVTFEKGVAGFNETTSKIENIIPLQGNSSRSLRVRVKLSSAATTQGIVGMGSEGTTRSSFNFYSAAGTWVLITYGDNLDTAVASDTNWNDLVATYNNVTNLLTVYLNGSVIGTPIVLGGSLNTNSFLRIGQSAYEVTPLDDGEIELIEIYNKPLTAEEVSNLYSDARYVLPSLEHERQVDDNMNVSDCINDTYTTFTNGTPTGFHVISNGASTQYAGTVDEISFVAGQKYIVSFDLVLNSGIHPRVNLFDKFPAGAVYSDYRNSVVGNNVMEFISDTTTTGVIGFYNQSAVTDYEITNLKVQLQTVEPTSKILEVSAKDGVARNLLSGDRNGVELMDIGKGQFISGTESWVGFGTNTLENDNGSLKITHVSDLGGAYTYLREIYDLNTDLVIDNTYRIHVRAKRDTDTNVRLRFRGTTNLYSDLLTTEYEWYILERTADFVSGMRLQLDSFSEGSVWIDQWWIEEVIPEVINTDIEVVKDGIVRSMLLNGSSSFVNSKMPLPDLDFTIMNWVKSSEITGTENCMFGYDSTSMFCRISGDQEIVCQIYDGVTNINFTSLSADGVPRMLWNWRHVAVTFKNKTFSLYVDGVFIESLQNAAFTSRIDGDVEIGRRSTGTNFHGLQDDFRMIDGIVSDEEISQYYTATKHKYNK